MAVLKGEIVARGGDIQGCNQKVSGLSR